jgi:hypothetical protein
LNEYKGCHVTTAEIIWKYYQAMTASHEKLRRRELKKKNDVMMNATSDTTTANQEDKMHYEDVLSLI